MTLRRSRSRRRTGLWLVLLVAGGFAAWSGREHWGRSGPPAYSTNAFYEVRRGDLLVSVMEDGALRALNETVVRNNLEGLNRIIHLVPEGTHVRKGELLVELDSSGLRERLNELELSYQDRLFQLVQAEGNLRIQRSLAESEIKDAELKLENGESDLEKYRDGDAPLLLRTVEARAAVLGEQVRIARERLTRTQELFQGGNATRSELEADTLSLKREQLGLSQYEEDLRLIKKFDQPNQLRLLEAKVQQARQELERSKQRTSNEVAQAEADVKTSERAAAAVQDAVNNQKRRLENTKIFAPQDGLVIYASVSPFFSMDGGMERRRDEGRGRGGRGPGGGGDNGEFRGGGRRGGRMGADSTGGSSATARAGQTGGSATGSTSGSTGGAATGGAGGGAGATGSPGAGGGGAGAGMGDAGAKGGASFVSYASMRPSSVFKPSGANAAGANAAGGTAASSSSSSSASGQTLAGGNAGASFASPFMGRSGFQGSSGWSGYEYSGTPGMLEEGMMVRQRQELIQLPDVSRMVAEIKVHESRVRQIRPGLTALVRIESIPDRRFKATVRRVAPLPDAQMSWLNPNLKVFSTDLLIEDPLPDLKPGVSVRAEVIITNLSRVLTVPIQAVARLAGENVCFIQKGSSVAPVAVTTGWFNDRFQEITAGLKEGDRVLLAPPIDDGIDDAGEESEAPPVAAAEAPVERPGENNAGTNQGPTSTEEPRLRGRGAAGNEGEGRTEPRDERGAGRRSRRAKEPAE